MIFGNGDITKLVENVLSVRCVLKIGLTLVEMMSIQRCNACLKSRPIWPIQQEWVAAPCAPCDRGRDALR
jgi:hypothetical protein